MTEFNPADPAFWDRSAATYAELSEPFTGLFAADALALAEIGPGTRVLDVATGTGVAAAMASAKGAEVTAVDFSPGMIAAVTALQLPRVTARVMDGQALDLADGAFDVTVSAFGAVLFPDWRKGLREMARVTRRGGIGVVASWASTYGAGTYKLLSELRAGLFPELALPLPFDGIVTLRSAAIFAAEMEKAGFGDVEVREVTHDFLMKLETPGRTEELFRLTPMWNDLSAGQQEAINAELAARVARDRVGDALPIPSTALIARGVRL